MGIDHIFLLVIGIIVITGGLYLLGEARSWKERQSEMKK